MHAPGLGFYLFNASVEMYIHLANDNQNQNIVYSPFSISTLLSMLLAGARGRTANEISDFLKAGDQEENMRRFAEARCGLSTPNVVFRIANKLYSSREFAVKEEYAALLDEFYRASIESVDFKRNPDAIRREVNEWVSKETNSKIQNLLGPGSVSAQTALILVNAIYFKANWDSFFNPRDTSSSDFHLDSENTVEVEMMFQEEEYKVAHFEESKCRALEMPYAGHEYSMVIILPDEVDGLTSLEEQLTGYNLQSLFRRLKTKRLVQLSLPKFKVQRNMGMNDVLRALGLENLFGEADLSGIFDNGSPSVSRIIHEAVVEVNENGTVAAAASAALMLGSSLNRYEPIKFFADHPFMFLIKRNQDNLIIFMGSVRDPKA